MQSNLIKFSSIQKQIKKPTRKSIQDTLKILNQYAKKGFFFCVSIYVLFLFCGICIGKYVMTGIDKTIEKKKINLLDVDKIFAECEDAFKNNNLTKDILLKLWESEKLKNQNMINLNVESKITIDKLPFEFNFENNNLDKLENIYLQLKENLSILKKNQNLLIKSEIEKFLRKLYKKKLIKIFVILLIIVKKSFLVLFVSFLFWISTILLLGIRSIKKKNHINLKKTKQDFNKDSNPDFNKDSNPDFNKDSNPDFNKDKNSFVS